MSEPKLFRPRGALGNDSKYATAARIMSLQQMLAFRDTWTQPPSEGFDVFNIIHESRMEKSDKIKEELKMSENGWKQTDKTQLSDLDLAVRQVQNNLNKITHKNFDELCEQILKNEHILHPEVIPKIVNRFFEKALDEPVFAELYAKLCFEIAKFEGQQNACNSGTQKSNIRVSIINAAQNVFEHEGDFDEEHCEEEKKDTFRKRKVNNIRFVAELFKQQMISRKIISHILKSKLMTEEAPNESDAEVSCQLLMSIGYILDQDEGHGVENVFKRVESLVNMQTKPYSNRVKFMLMDLLDMRSGGWKSKEKQKKPDEGFHMTPAEFKAREAAEKAEKEAKEGKQSTPASPVYQDPAGQFNAEEAKLEEELRKAHALALPPSVDAGVERKAVNAIKEVLNETKEGADRDAALNKVVAEELSTVVPQCSQRDSRTASVCFILKYACSSSRDEEREKMISVLANENVWKDKNELFRGVSWCFVSGIADGVKEDCPKFFQRFGLAVAQLVESSCATFQNVVKDVFARSANYLHAVAVYEKDLYSYDWDEEYTNLWEQVVKQVETTDKSKLPAVNEILDQFGSLKVSDFLARVTCDIVGTLMEHSLCTSDELRAWVDEKVEKAKTVKGENKMQRLIDEVQMLC